jgi:threonine dehydrogenase-like Zn-dependent dehydrogenase
VTEPADRQALLTALTTEHFTLQGARSTTVSENTGRSSVYLTAVSSALVALGFIGQVSEVGDTFRLFALAVIPVLFWLGLLTFVRVLEKSVEDLYYARAINRIRHYYLELAGDHARYFLLSGNDDVAGVFANMATSPSRAQLLYSAATTIGVVNSVVGGSGVALLVGAATEAPPGVAVACGAAAAATLIVIHVAHERRTFTRALGGMEVAFPS